MDYMQELDSMMKENKVVLERLRGENFSSYSSEDMFYRAKTLMELGYPVYVIISYLYNSIRHTRFHLLHLFYISFSFLTFLT